VGTHSYLFRSSFRNYVVDHGGKSEIPVIDTFICQQTTAWSGLGVRIAEHDEKNRLNYYLSTYRTKISHQLIQIESYPFIEWIDGSTLEMI
jgi:hypothetical protein